MIWWVSDGIVSLPGGRNHYIRLTIRRLHANENMLILGCEPDDIQIRGSLHFCIMYMLCLNFVITDICVLGGRIPLLKAVN